MTGSELSGRLADLRQMERDGTDTSETQAALIEAHLSQPSDALSHELAARIHAQEASHD